MLNHLLNGISAIGNVVDLPASSVRDMIGGENPFDQWATPFHSENRLSGRDMLRNRGLVGQHDTWGNFAAGLGAELALDPLNLIGTGALGHLTKSRGLLKAEQASVRAHNANSMRMRAMRFLPEENIPLMHPAVKNADGTPKVFYHGTPHAYDHPTVDLTNITNLHGPGYYTSDSKRVTGGPNGYWMKDYQHPHVSATVKRGQEENLAKAVRDIETHVNPSDSYFNNHLKDANEAAFHAQVLLDSHYVEPHERLLAAANNQPYVRNPMTVNTEGYPQGWVDHLKKFMHVEEVPGDPTNVRMQFMDIRNPFDVDSKHSMVKVRQGIESLPIGAGSKSSAAYTLTNYGPHSDIIESVRKARNMKNESVLRRKAFESELKAANARYKSLKDAGVRISEDVMSELKHPVIVQRNAMTRARQSQKQFTDEAMEAFRRRHEGIAGEDVSRFIKDTRELGLGRYADMVKAMGHDSVIHTGGGRVNVRAKPHQVAIAYSPDQVYAPYVAPMLQGEPVLPTDIRPFVGGLMGTINSLRGASLANRR